MIKGNRFLSLLAAATLSVGMLACSTTSTTDTSTSTSTSSDMSGTTAVTTTTTTTNTETDVKALDYTASGLNRDNTYADGVTDPTSVKQANAMNTNAEVKVTPNIGTTGNVEAIATKEVTTSTTTDTTMTTRLAEPVEPVVTTSTTTMTTDDDTATTTTTHRRMSKN